MKVTTELVDVFWEKNVPVMFMYQNGTTSFYRPRRMTKEEVRHYLVQLNAPEDEKTKD